MEKANEEKISRVSLEVIKEIAPEEIDLFDDVKDEFLKNPKTFNEKDPKKREKMLGFGGAMEAGQLVTSVVLPIVSDAIKKYLEKKIEQKTENKLDREKIKKVRDDAYNSAIAMGLSEDKAAMMADSIVGKMVLLG